MGLTTRAVFSPDLVRGIFTCFQIWKKNCLEVKKFISKDVVMEGVNKLIEYIHLSGEYKIGNN